MYLIIKSDSRKIHLYEFHIPNQRKNISCKMLNLIRLPQCICKIAQKEANKKMLAPFARKIYKRGSFMPDSICEFKKIIKTDLRIFQCGRIIHNVEAQRFYTYIGTYIYNDNPKLDSQEAESKLQWIRFSNPTTALPLPINTDNLSYNFFFLEELFKLNSCLLTVILSGISIRYMYTYLHVYVSRFCLLVCWLADSCDRTSSLRAHIFLKKIVFEAIKINLIYFHCWRWTSVLFFEILFIWVTFGCCRNTDAGFVSSTTAIVPTSSSISLLQSHLSRESSANNSFLYKMLQIIPEHEQEKRNIEIHIESSINGFPFSLLQPSKYLNIRLTTHKFSYFPWMICTSVAAWCVAIAKEAENGCSRWTCVRHWNKAMFYKVTTSRDVVFQSKIKLCNISMNPRFGICIYYGLLYFNDNIGLSNWRYDQSPWSVN